MVIMVNFDNSTRSENILKAIYGIIESRLTSAVIDKLIHYKVLLLYSHDLAGRGLKDIRDMGWRNLKPTVQ